jgi:hypothetical protein
MFCISVYSPLSLIFEQNFQCRNPTLAKCGGEARHFQSWGFGVLRTPECLELDSKAQKTSH